MRELKLTDGYVALVDDEDHEVLSRIKWVARKDKAGNVYGTATVQIHRLVMGSEPGKVIDHVDGDTLNNTKENLEFVTTQVNSLRVKKFPRNKTGYRYGLGSFKTREEAGAAYEIAAIKFFGNEAPKSKIENWVPPKRIPREKLLQVLQKAGVL